MSRSDGIDRQTYSAWTALSIAVVSVSCNATVGPWQSSQRFKNGEEQHDRLWQPPSYGSATELMLHGHRPAAMRQNMSLQRYYLGLAVSGTDRSNAFTAGFTSYKDAAIRSGRTGDCEGLPHCIFRLVFTLSTQLPRPFKPSTGLFT